MLSPLRSRTRWSDKPEASLIFLDCRIIPLDQCNKLAKLIGLRLTSLILRAQVFRNINPHADMMAADYSHFLESKRLE